MVIVEGEEKQQTYVVYIIGWIDLQRKSPDVHTEILDTIYLKY